MKLDTFIEHLDRYGPDFEHWPIEFQAPARELVTSSTEAARAIEQAQQLSALLGDLPGRPAPGDLARRIADLAATRRNPWDRLAHWFGGSFWRPALAASVPLALGFILGFNYQQPADADDAYLLEAVGLLPFSRNFEELPYEE